MSDRIRPLALALSVLIGAATGYARQSNSFSSTPELFWATWPAIAWERQHQGRRLPVPMGGW